MKKTYQPPQIEVIALGTEQRILDVSFLTLMATTSPSDDAKDMIVSGTEAW